MGTFSEDTDKKVLDHYIGAQALTPPATIYVGVSSTTIAGDGTGITEPTIGVNGYARVAVTNNNTNFPNATIVTAKAQKKNGTAITFPQASGTWGAELTDVFLVSASTGGTMLAYAVMSVPKTITTGDTLNFAIDSLTFRLG